MVDGQKIILVSCDIRKNSGEGALALDLTRRVDLNRKPNTKVISINYPFSLEKLGGRLAYLWLWSVLFKNLFIRTKRSLFVFNFLPLWNVITFALLKKDVVTAPITGNANLNFNNLYCSKVQKFKLLLIRQCFLKVLTFLSLLVIRKRRLNVIAATPEVAKVLKVDQPPGPYVWTGQAVNDWLAMHGSKDIWNNEREHDLIVYTNNHTLKNNLLLFETLKELNNLGIQCGVLVRGKETLQRINGVKYLRPKSKSDYYNIIFRSAVCLQLSLEGAGIFPFECSYLGVPVIGFSRTGAAYLPDFIAIDDSTPELLTHSIIKAVLHVVKSGMSVETRLALHKKCVVLQSKIDSYYDKRLHPCMRNL